MKGRDTFKAFSIALWDLCVEHDVIIRAVDSTVEVHMQEGIGDAPYDADALRDMLPRSHAERLSMSRCTKDAYT